MTLNNLACSSIGISLISSRNSEPEPASSSKPVFSRSAPVKAPLTWPKSSLSSRLAVRAAQFTATNCSFGCLMRCIALAASSFPVPVSPTIKIGLQLLVATILIVFSFFRIALLCPTMQTEAAYSSAKKSFMFV